MHSHLSAPSSHHASLQFVVGDSSHGQTGFASSSSSLLSSGGATMIVAKGMHSVDCAPPSTASARRKRPTPLGSTLLTDAENQLLFQILGPNRISLTAGVAQLFASASPDASTAAWQKQNAGAVAFVKDYQRKCYCIEMFDVFNWRLLWSQTLYKEFRATFYPNCPRFVVFEGDNCVFGLNFADHADAEHFKAHLKKQSEHERTTGGVQRNDGRPAGQRPLHAVSSAPTVQTPQRTAAAGGGITSLGTVAHFGGTPLRPSANGAAASAKKAAKKEKNDKKNGKKPRHRKEDISNPTDFKHLVHLGWDQDGGFNREVYETEHMDETVRSLLHAVGRNADEMNADEMKFVYQFVRENVFDANNGQQAHPSASMPQQQQQRPVIGAPMPIAGAAPSQSHMSHHHPGVQRMHTMSSIDQPYYYQHQSAPSQPATTQQWPKAPVQAQYSYQPPTSVTMRQPPPRPPPATGGAYGGQPPKTVQDVGALSRGPLPPLPQQIQPVLPAQQQMVRNDGAQRLNVPPPPPPPVPQSTRSGGDATGGRSAGSPPPPPPPPSAPGVVGSSGPPPPPPPPPANSFAGSNNGNGNGLPPPPPAPSAKPALANDRSNLLQQIQAGTKLRRVDAQSSDKKPTPTNPPTARDHLMDQIKSGSQLKHVDSEEEAQRRSAVNVQDLGGIAGALARALEERRRNLVNSEDSDDSGAGNDSEWEDD